MADYWGLKEIAKRMGWKSPATPLAKLKAEGFPMYRNRRGKSRVPRWYTNDNLILEWELRKCQQARDSLLEPEKKTNSEAVAKKTYE